MVPEIELLFSSVSIPLLSRLLSVILVDLLALFPLTKAISLLLGDLLGESTSVCSSWSSYVVSRSLFSDLSSSMVFKESLDLRLFACLLILDL